MLHARRTAAAALVAAAALTAPAAAGAATDPVETKVLEEHFDGANLPSGWAATEGDWKIENGRLAGSSPNTSQLSRIAFGPRLENFRFEATVRFESVVNPARWTALALDLQTDGKPPWSQAALRSASTATNGAEFAIRTGANAWNVTDTAAAPSDAGTGKDVRVRIDVQGTSGTWYFNGQKLMTTKAIQRSADGRLGFVVNGAKVTFDDVVVTKIAGESLVLPDDGTKQPRVVAHRGYSRITPENSLVAMTTGHLAGADWVETDVATNADGVPYILHDNTVDRTTDGTGALSALRSGYLDTLDAGSWFNPVFTGQKLPSLDALLDRVKGDNSKLLLEIKGPETPAEVARIVAAVRAKGLLGRTLVQSFDEAVVRASLAAEPDLPAALLRGALDADPVAKARELGVVAYNPSWDAIKGRPEAIKQLNAAGVAVMPYTVDNADEWAKMDAAGVDGIITNRPGELVGWNLRDAQQPPAPAPEPARVAVLAPRDGAVLERGDDVSVALGLEHASEVAATLDGEAIAEGEAISADDLTLGAHELRVTAKGEDGKPATATSTFRVEATPEGYAHLAATIDGVPTTIRTVILNRALDRDWRGVRTAIALFRGRIAKPAAALLDADAKVLAGRR